MRGTTHLPSCSHPGRPLANTPTCPQPAALPASRRLPSTGDWAAVFDTQQAAATDAETLAAERRALAVQAMAARAAEGPGGGAAPPQPPHWFMGQLGLFPGQMPPPGMVMGDEFDVRRAGSLVCWLSWRWWQRVQG